MKGEVVALRDQQFYRFSFQLWAEMKIPFQRLSSISAGWHARQCVRVHASASPMGSARSTNVYLYGILYGELAGSRDHKFIFWSHKFISANRFHFSKLLK
jgi:hypothetical protein